MSEPNPDRGLVIHAGPVEIDIPRSLGYYGGIAVAVGAGMIEPPLALFIGAIPLAKMLMRGGAPQPIRFLGQVFDGAAKPVGGDAEGTIRVEDDHAGTDDEHDSQLASPLTRTDPKQQAAVRQWAKEHGHKLSSPGRIPASVWEAYEAAQ